MSSRLDHSLSKPSPGPASQSDFHGNGHSSAQPPSSAAGEPSNSSSAWVRLSRLVTGGFGSTKSNSPAKDESLSTPRTPNHRSGHSISRLIQARLVSSTIFQTGASSLDLAYNVNGEITAIDLNRSRDCVVMAGRDLLKIVRVDRSTCAEEFNIRQTVARGQISTGEASPRKPPLTREAFDIHDVKWCHGRFSNVIATAAAFSRVVLYDVTAPVPITPRARYGLSITRMNEHQSQVHKLAFNPHQSGQLLSASQDGTVTLWDLRDLRTEKATLNGALPVGSMPSRSRFCHTSGGSFRDVKWSPADPHVFAAATDRGTVVSWDIRFPRNARTAFLAHSGFASSVDWHPAGRWLASGGSDSTVKVWDMYIPAEERTDGVTGRRFSGIIARPQWTLQTPFPVVNLQWRPPARSPIPTSSAFFDIDTTGAGSFDSWTAAENASVANLPPGATPTGSAWLTTQFSTSYSRDYPQIHVWDLRRPHVPLYEVLRPFRESGPVSEDHNLADNSYSGLFKYRPAGRFVMTNDSTSQGAIEERGQVEDLPSYAGRTAPADMIWHSRDMLWVGGRDGIFCQVDVARGKMTYKPVERRAWSHVSVGARGEGVIIAAERAESGSREPKENVVDVPVVTKSGPTLSLAQPLTERKHVQVPVTGALAVELNPLSGPTLAAGSPLAKAIAIANLKNSAAFVEPITGAKKRKEKELRIGADDAVDGLFLSLSPAQNGEFESGNVKKVGWEGSIGEDGMFPPMTPCTPITPSSASPDRAKKKTIRSRPSFSGGFGMAAALAAVGMRLGGDNVRSGSGTDENPGAPIIWPPSAEVTTVHVPGRNSNTKGGDAYSRPSGPIRDGLDFENGVDDGVEDSVDDDPSTSASTSSCENTLPKEREPRVQKRKQKHWQRQVVVPIHVIPLDESLSKRGAVDTMSSDLADGQGLKFVKQRQGRVILPGMAPLIRPDGPVDSGIHSHSWPRLFLPSSLFDMLRRGTGQIICPDDPSQPVRFEPSPEGLQKVCSLISATCEHNAQISSRNTQLRTAQAFRILGLISGWWLVGRVVGAGTEMEKRITNRSSSGMEEGKYEPGGLWPPELMYGHNTAQDEGSEFGQGEAGSVLDESQEVGSDYDELEDGLGSRVDGRFRRRCLSETLSTSSASASELAHRPQSTPPETTTKFEVQRVGESGQSVSSGGNDPTHQPWTPDSKASQSDYSRSYTDPNLECVRARKILGLQYSDFMAEFDPSAPLPPSLSGLPVPSPDFPIRLPAMMSQVMLLFSQSARTADTLSQMLLVMLPILGLVAPQAPDLLSGDGATPKQRYSVSALASLRSALEASLSPALSSDPSLIPGAMRHLASVAKTVDPLHAEAVISAYVDQLIRRRDYISAAILRRITFPIYVSVWEAGCIGVSVALGGGRCGRAVKGVYDWGGLRVKPMDEDENAIEGTGRYRPSHLGNLATLSQGRRVHSKADLVERLEGGTDIDWGAVMERCREASIGFVPQGHRFGQSLYIRPLSDSVSNAAQTQENVEPESGERTLLAPSASLLTWRGVICDGRTKCVIRQEHTNNLAAAACDICSCLQSPYSRPETRSVRPDSMMTASAIGLGLGVFADSQAKGFFAELVAAERGVGQWHGGRADHVVRVDESRQRNEKNNRQSTRWRQQEQQGHEGKDHSMANGDRYGSVAFSDMIFPPPIYPSVLSACLVCGHVAHAACKAEWFSATRVFSTQQRRTLHELRARRKADPKSRQCVLMDGLSDEDEDDSDSYEPRRKAKNAAFRSPTLWRDSFYGQCHFPGCQCACLPISDWGRKNVFGSGVSVGGGPAGGRRQTSTAFGSGAVLKARSTQFGFSSGGVAPSADAADAKAGFTPHSSHLPHQRNSGRKSTGGYTSQPCRPGPPSNGLGRMPGYGYGYETKSVPLTPGASQASQEERPDVRSTNEGHLEGRAPKEPASTQRMQLELIEDYAQDWDPYPTLGSRSRHSYPGQSDEGSSEDDEESDDYTDADAEDDIDDEDDDDCSDGGADVENGAITDDEETILERDSDRPRRVGMAAGEDGGPGNGAENTVKFTGKKSLLGAFFGRMK